MSTPHEKAPAPAAAPPSSPAAAPPRRSAVVAFFRWTGRLVLALASLANLAFVIVVLGLLVWLLTGAGKGDGSLAERFYTGDRAARDKVAVVRVEGVLLEGFTTYAEEQIAAAARDDRVKAVVLRIVSPGGSITASDRLHKLLGDLRHGTHPRHPGRPKPVVVSMGSLAASGGYYIAMIPGDPPTVLFAEPTTITGSIGVFAMFPNVKKLADKYGVAIDTVKAGDLKASGSPFKEMTPQERQVWQSLVDHAYLRFLDVIAAARKPHLTRKSLQRDLHITEDVPIREGPRTHKKVSYQRYLADGGIFTSAQAVRYRLVDRTGYLDDAVREAARQAGLGDNYQAITYDRPRTLLRALLGIRSPGPALKVDAGAVSAALAPRLWYLAPHHQLAGMVTALGD
jgi:protease-4